MAAEALERQDAAMSGFRGEVIRFHPTRILGFGIDSQTEGMSARDVPAQPFGIPIQEPIK